MKRILWIQRTKGEDHFQIHRDYFQYAYDNLSSEGYHIDIYDPMKYKIYDIKNKRFIRSLSDRAKKKHNMFVKFILNVFYLRKLLYNNPNYDIIHLFGARYEYLFVNFGKTTPKVAMSILGSDFYRNKYKFLYKKLYKTVDVVLHATKETGNNIISYFKEAVKDKTKLLIFPIPMLDHINKNNSKRESNTINILCGVNACENEQHDVMIEEIKKIPKYSDIILLMFLLTYEDAYEKRIKLSNHIKKELKDFNVTTYTEFLPIEELAEIINSTEVFINMRRTDIFCGTIIETLYSGAYIITGDWLPYGLLDDNKIEYKSIGNPSELSNAIEEYIVNREKYGAALKRNQEIAESLFSPQKVVNEWKKLYEELL